MKKYVYMECTDVYAVYYYQNRTKYINRNFVGDKTILQLKHNRNSNYLVFSSR